MWIKKGLIWLVALFLFLHSGKTCAQIPNPALVGYWHNWNDASAPYIPLDQVDSRYNVIIVSFAESTSPSNMNMNFVPDGITPAALTAKIQTLKNAGKKVLISVGGANGTVDLTTTANKNAFITTMTNIVNTYGFDGIDIDIENGASILVNGGTIAAPSSIAVQNLIAAIQSIMGNFMSTYGYKMLLTMAPETAYVQGGKSAFGSIWGGYLPIIHALRNELDLLHVQLYNSGSMYANDNNIYNQGTADFIVGMTEAVIKGFNTAGGFFTGIPASKVAVGLPACSSAAGGGFVSTSNVKAAMDYLRGVGPKPGSYTLIQAGGYPDLRGMMTWSINWDKVATCGAVYEYAQNFQTIYGITLPTELLHFSGKKTGTANHLSWTFTPESNFQQVVLERSENGIDEWIELASFENKGKSNYGFSDEDPLPLCYYRLKILEKDGKFSFSALIEIDKIGSEDISVYPNPLHDYLKIKYSAGPDESIVLTLTDSRANQVLKQDIELSKDRNAELQLDLSGLPNGIYALQIIAHNQIVTKKIFKE